MKRIFLLLSVLVGLHGVLNSRAESTAPPRDMPVAPIAPVAFEGWTNAYRLANAEITMVLVPEIGRVMFLGPTDGNNLLRVDDALKGRLPSTNVSVWANFGGDWVWPISQARWANFADGDWPPPRLLDGRPWQGHGWRNADGESCFRMTQTYGKPLHIKVTRLFKVPAAGAVVTVEQQCERTAASKYPVTLWNISQISGASHVVLPNNPDSTFTNGYRVMMGKAPSTNALRTCADKLVYSTESCSELKLGLDRQPAWIAALGGKHLLLERMIGGKPGSSYPDDGCSIEMYSNKGLGYTEIELLGQELSLEVGAVAANTLTWRIMPFQMHSASSPCAPAEAIGAMLKTSE